MDAIYIPQLTRLPERTATVSFDESLPDLETLTPVKGYLQVKHQGNYLDVFAKAETILTLTCHRCLKHYNYRLEIEPTELIWLNEDSPTEPNATDLEIALEDLVESLSPQGYFQPTDWLYQQLCLEIPQKQLCSHDCSGIEVNQKVAKLPRPTVDRRWASLEVLKNQLPRQN
ncbi:metal-binding protein [Leptolyngbya sp. 'hensonii']|uniref:YceD family protein n=1 Tax=Leptolyngbya sp. 'hensonii' TaxID=1922337 RepID=UPI00094F525D|nr:YceD family protein [Leptolyngbya sp. 'hensonii']OLP19652.1 metal-binding protein [Leptolyngbya sp. 'hensonii']